MFKEKHHTDGYLDTAQVDYENTYTIRSKPSIYGWSLVFQYVTMKDGTVYRLASNTGSTRGIIGRIREDNKLHREVKALWAEADAARY